LGDYGDSVLKSAGGIAEATRASQQRAAASGVAASIRMRVGCGGKICQDIPVSVEAAMAFVRVGRWGKNLAIRFPFEIARVADLSDGERVEIATRDGEIVIRRPAADLNADALAAANEIIEESRDHSLGSATVRALLDEGRRG
jgi:antitoxin MazE